MCKGLGSFFEKKSHAGSLRGIGVIKNQNNLTEPF
ncbi:hypothetical protein IX307_001185 [Bacteroides pyogenes]|nr:hypothetical protein [Bacteroides pyogenes]